MLLENYKDIDSEDSEQNSLELKREHSTRDVSECHKNWLVAVIVSRSMSTALATPVNSSLFQ